MVRYIRADDRIIFSSKATHKLTQDICCAGYLRILNKGAYVSIGKEWTNYYGRWVDIIDEQGLHYSIRPDEVKNVTEELPQADTIEELCDMFVVVDKERHIQLSNVEDTNKECLKRDFFVSNNYIVYGAIWTDKGLIYVAKMNEQGEWVLL